MTVTHPFIFTTLLKKKKKGEKDSAYSLALKLFSK